MYSSTSTREIFDWCTKSRYMIYLTFYHFLRLKVRNQNGLSLGGPSFQSLLFLFSAWFRVSCLIYVRPFWELNLKCWVFFQIWNFIFFVIWTNVWYPPPPPPTPKAHILDNKYLLFKPKKISISFGKSEISLEKFWLLSV